MPYLRLITNQKLSPNASESFLGAASQVVSTALGKNEKYFMGAISDEQTMIFDGGTAPAAFLSLEALGLPADKTTELSSALCSLVTKHLEISSERTYLRFADVERGMWGWNNGVF